VSPKIIALTIFALAYLLFIIKSDKRSYVSIAGAVLLILLGVLSPFQAFFAINWNVMGIFVGTLVVSEIFIESKVPAFIAEYIVNKSKNTAWAILSICLLTGFISAFVENVATVLIVAPIALSLAKRLKINPVNMMISIAVSSNLQGCATLIGDPPSMLLGGFAKMNFMDFFFYHGKPSIFFAVEIGAVVSFFVLMWIFRRENKKVEIKLTQEKHDWVPAILLVIMVLLLASSSFYDSGFSYAAGIICMIFGAIALIYRDKVNNVPVKDTFKGLDWDTTFFLMGVFVLVGSITSTGLIEKASILLSSLVGNNLFMGYTFLVFMSVALSAFIDNVPFLAAMLPLAISMSNKLGISPSLFLFGLLIGASLGGNITPIGASANIVACGLLKKEGHNVSFGQFAKIGLPFTLAAVSAAYLFVWFIWH
jgi:Na+/H+ antiporter NhaD/arsenite permease-like protein